MTPELVLMFVVVIVSIVFVVATWRATGAAQSLAASAKEAIEILKSKTES